MMERFFSADPTDTGWPIGEALLYLKCSVTWYINQIGYILYIYKIYIDMIHVGLYQIPLYFSVNLEDNYTYWLYKNTVNE